MLTALGEQLVEELRIAGIEVPEQFVGELAVRLGEVAVGCRCHCVREGASPTLRLRARHPRGLDQPLFYERAEMLTSAAHRHAELVRHLLRRRFTPTTDCVEHRAPTGGKGGACIGRGGVGQTRTSARAPKMR